MCREVFDEELFGRAITFIESEKMVVAESEKEPRRIHLDAKEAERSKARIGIARNALLKSEGSVEKLIELYCHEGASRKALMELSGDIEELVDDYRLGRRPDESFSDSLDRIRDTFNQCKDIITMDATMEPCRCIEDVIRRKDRGDEALLKMSGSCSLLGQLIAASCDEESWIIRKKVYDELIGTGKAKAEISRIISGEQKEKLRACCKNRDQAFVVSSFLEGIGDIDTHFVLINGSSEDGIRLTCINDDESDPFKVYDLYNNALYQVVLKILDQDGPFFVPFFDYSMVGNVVGERVSRAVSNTIEQVGGYAWRRDAPNVVVSDSGSPHILTSKYMRYHVACRDERIVPSHGSRGRFFLDVGDAGRWVVLSRIDALAQMVFLLPQFENYSKPDNMAMEHGGTWSHVEDLYHLVGDLFEDGIRKGTFREGIWRGALFLSGLRVEGYDGNDLPIYFDNNNPGQKKSDCADYVSNYKDNDVKILDELETIEKRLGLKLPTHGGTYLKIYMIAEHLRNNSCGSLCDSDLNQMLSGIEGSSKDSDGVVEDLKKALESKERNDRDLNLCLKAEYLLKAGTLDDALSDELDAVLSRIKKGVAEGQGHMPIDMAYARLEKIVEGEASLKSLNPIMFESYVPNKCDKAIDRQIVSIQQVTDVEQVAQWRQMDIDDKLTKAESSLGLPLPLRKPSDKSNKETEGETMWWYEFRKRLSRILGSFDAGLSYGAEPQDDLDKCEWLLRKLEPRIKESDNDSYRRCKDVYEAIKSIEDGTFRMDNRFISGACEALRPKTERRNDQSRTEIAKMAASSMNKELNSLGVQYNVNIGKKRKPEGALVAILKALYDNLSNKEADGKNAAMDNDEMESKLKKLKGRLENDELQEIVRISEEVFEDMRTPYIITRDDGELPSEQARGDTRSKRYHLTGLGRLMYAGLFRNTMCSEPSDRFKALRQCGLDAVVADFDEHCYLPRFKIPMPQSCYRLEIVDDCACDPFHVRSCGHYIAWDGGDAEEGIVTKKKVSIEVCENYYAHYDERTGNATVPCKCDRSPECEYSTFRYFNDNGSIKKTNGTIKATFNIFIYKKSSSIENRV